MDSIHSERSGATDAAGLGQTTLRGQLGLGDTMDHIVPTSTGFKIDVTGPVTAALKKVTVKKERALAWATAWTTSSVARRRA